MLTNLYDTDVTIQSGDGIADHDTELTDLIVNLDTSKYNSYWLYWINWDKVSLPGSFKSFYFELSSSKISAINTTPAQNLAATYLSRKYGDNSISTDNCYQVNDFLVGQSSFTELTNLGSQCRFYNNYCILKNAPSMLVPSERIPFVIFAEGANIQTCINAEPPAQSITNQQFYDFIMNGEDITFTINGWSNKGTSAYLFDPVEFTINREDFQGGICTITKNILENEHWNSYTFTIFISEYGIIPGRDINVEGDLTKYTSPVPCLLMKENNEIHLRTAAGGTLLKAPTHAYNQHINYNLQNNTITTNEGQMYIVSEQGPYDTHCYAGGLEFEVEKDDLDRMSGYSIQTYGNALFYRLSTNSNNFYIFRPIPIEEIETHINLYQRFRVNTILTPTFEFSDDYGVPFIDETEMAMDELHIGDYETIGEDLRPWQEGYFNQNTLDPDSDIPEYEPDGPGGEPDEGDRGDEIDKWNWGLKPGLGYFINYGVFSESGLTELAIQLWNKPDGFFKKISASISNDFMEFFVSLKYFPLQIHGHTPIQNLYYGRGGHFVISNNYYVPDSVQEYDFGEVYIQRQYNNFLDYAPYTRIGIYLPYSGTWELNPTDVMGSKISLTLLVDIVEGSGIWLVYNEKYKQPILIKQCKIGVDFPITSLNASQMASNQINAILQGIQTTSSAVTNGVNSTLGVIGSGVGRGSGSGGSSGFAIAEQAMNVAQAGVDNSLAWAGSWLNYAQASKEIPQYSGASSGSVATVVNHTPYITYQRPLCQNPDNFNHTYGRIVNTTDYIKNREGFTSCNNIDLTGIDKATQSEKSQIKQMLESGIYV